MNVLEEANEIIFKKAQEKERQYGPINESLSKAANVASELCNKQITTEDMYKCLIALKISRMAYNNKRDTYVDALAYTAALFNYLNDEQI